MQLELVIGSEKLQALVDSGFTHTFIVASVAKRLVLPINPRPSLAVTVANGDHDIGNGVCPNTDISIGGKDFRVDCFSIPLEGFDMVLRIQSLVQKPQ